MTNLPLTVLSTGLISSVGLSAPAACAAIRANISNPTETLFTDSTGEWIMGHQVPLARPLRGLSRLVEMAALAIEECLARTPSDQWHTIPLIMCLAEPERSGRLSDLDDSLVERLYRRLNVRFAPESSVVARGRVSSTVALLLTRQLIEKRAAQRVLIAATDSLLIAETLHTLERRERLLTPANPNGFMPGEGAAAVLVGAATRGLSCTGLGFATETATIESEEPLRADGLVRAIKNALSEAGCEMHDLDFRITDISGEQYYFKEAALALSRVLRVRKAEFDLWHPAECLGETGAVSGLAGVIVAETACRKGYAKGCGILWHSASDNGHRAAAVLRSGA